MEKSGPPGLPDWVTVTTRWIFIIAVSIWVSFGEEMDWWVLSVVILAVVGNIIATIFVANNRISPEFRLVSTSGDFVLAALLFFMSLGTGRELSWIGLMPVISASLYYHWIGAISAVLINTLLQGGLAYLTMLQEDALWLIGIMLPIYILVGFGCVFTETRLRTLQWVKKTRPLPSDLQERKDLERRHTLYGLISELSATLNYQKVLETSLDLGATALAELGASTDRLVSAVMFFSGRDPNSPELSIATGRHLLTTDKSVNLPGIRGVLGQVIEKGNTIFTKDPKNDPELGQIVALRECRSACVLPLRAGMDAYGVLLFAHPEVDYFLPERREVLEIVRNQSTIAIQNARLYQALEQEKNRMMEIQEESRRKLARDLHDGPTQSISAIAMRVNFARRLMDRDPKSASEELFKIEDLARRTTKEIRHMLFTLRPLVLESQGLVAALESMAVKMGETYGEDVSIQVDQRAVEVLEPGKQAVVFYLAEEATNNARKHAQAKHIWVRLKLVAEGLSLLEIEDDGVGFDTCAVDASYESRGSLGMINLRERTELVNGLLRIESKKGQGTRVQVVIPLTEEAADRLRRGR